MPGPLVAKTRATAGAGAEGIFRQQCLTDLLWNPKTGSKEGGSVGFVLTPLGDCTDLVIKA